MKTPDVDDDAPPPDLGERVAAALRTPARILGALLVPDRVVPRVVREERYAGALVVVVACALAAAAAIGLRYDVRADVYARNAERPPPDVNLGAAGAADSAPALKSDRDIEAEIRKETAVARVKLGLGAGLGTPFGVLALGLGLYLVGRYVGGRPTLPRALAAAAHASLPGAVKSSLAAVVALRMPAVRPDEVDRLVPAGGVHHPLLAGVDLFSLWTVVLAGFGLAAAAELGRTRAFLTVLVGYALWIGVTRS